MANRWLSILTAKKAGKPVVRKRKKVKVRHGVRRPKIIVSDIMTRRIIPLAPFNSLEKALQVFQVNGISGAPILDKNRLVGVISKTDIIRLLKRDSLDNLTEEERVPLKRCKVSQLAKKPLWIRAEKSVEEARKKMDANNIKRLLVFDRRSKLVGIVTRTDLMKTISKEKIKENVSTKIDDLLRALENGPASFSELSKNLGISESLLEEWSKVLEEHGLIEVSYPALGSPVLKLKSAKAES